MLRIVKLVLVITAIVLGVLALAGAKLFGLGPLEETALGLVSLAVAVLL